MICSNGRQICTKMSVDFVQMACIKGLLRTGKVHPNMLQASRRKNKTASVVRARQERVAAGLFAEAKRQYLEDVTKFSRRQEEANKRRKNVLNQEIQVWQRAEKDAKGEVRRIKDGACDNKWVLQRAERRLEGAQFKCENKRKLVSAAEEKGWSGLEGEWIEKEYRVFKEFLPWWHGDRTLPQARDFEGMALRGGVEYRSLHRGVYEFARRVFAFGSLHFCLRSC